MTDQIQFFGPGTDEYIHGTQPHNSSGSQAPSFVAVPRSVAEVSAAVQEAVRRGLTVVPQATGHGAGGMIGADTVIIDTSQLDELSIDVSTRVARAGAGATWGQVNTEAEKHGVLGLAGSSPSVAISGYTFGGGVGWLARPHGMASAALRSVEYVDGGGAVRYASDDAADPIDREAIYAFRGGGGVGIATLLEFDLVPIPDLHAGYLLWSIDALESVVDAWADTVDDVGGDVATSISVLRAPPAPPFPEELQGELVVHLAIAASTGPDGALGLLEAVRSAGEPIVDTWGPSDLATLVGIHLDPPTAVPAIGTARWLTRDATSIARDILTVAARADSPLVMIEIRSVENHAAARTGAATTVPGPFILHAVGALQTDDDRSGIESALASLVTAAAPADTGRSVGSWMEGATAVRDALPKEIRSRVARAADAVDPHHVIHRSRFLT